MTSKRNIVIGAMLVALLVVLGTGQSLLTKVAAQSASTVMAPKFEVDPNWPKPLPNQYQLGQTIGVAVDANDHVWIVHRANPDEVEAGADNGTAGCCHVADPIMEFDQAGNLLRHWGGKDGPGYQWPASNHGIWIDYKGNVWIGGNGNGSDGMVLKFTQDGKFLNMFGIKKQGLGPDSLATDRFYLVAKIHVYPKTNEAFIADGYGNKRVAVLDADTGKMKRYWGAYGNKPDDTKLGNYNPNDPPAQQFRNPVHCVERSNDGLVYVCDRANDRLQVFQPDGKFVKEAFYAKNTRGAGSVWDITFSKDPDQRFMFLADGQNERVRVILRDTLEELTSFGDGGRQPGQFYGVHSIASDSKGNLYTTETYEGKRVQKFVYQGIASQPRGYQGVPWPRR